MCRGYKEKQGQLPKNGKKKPGKAKSKEQLKLKLKKEKQTKPKKKVTVPTSDFCDASFRRTLHGRDNILSFMKILHDLDGQVFPLSPTFAVAGTCRMKFPGAESITWQEILDGSSAAIEAMQLDSFSVFFLSIEFGTNIEIALCSGESWDGIFVGPFRCQFAAKLKSWIARM